MPTRILRDGILQSVPVDRLTLEAELLYRRLMSVADDNGRYHGLPALIRAACYPLRVDRVSVEDVARWLTELTSGDSPLVLAYSVAGIPLIQIEKFRQKVRTPKFAGPDQADTSVASSSASNLAGKSAGNLASEPASSSASNLAGKSAGLGVVVVEGGVNTPATQAAKAPPVTKPIPATESPQADARTPHPAPAVPEAEQARVEREAQETADDTGLTVTQSSFAGPKATASPKATKVPVKSWASQRYDELLLIAADGLTYAKGMPMINKLAGGKTPMFSKATLETAITELCSSGKVVEIKDLYGVLTQRCKDIQGRPPVGSRSRPAPVSDKYRENLNDYVRGSNG
jgi:hypothetical protein